MVTRDSLKDHFEELGIDVKEEVLDKCIEVCILHNIDETTFVETWMAFSIMNLSGNPPTIETVTLMERKELSKENTTSVTPNSKTSLSRYNSSTSKRSNLDRDLNTTPKSIHGQNAVECKTRNSNVLSPTSHFIQATTILSNISHKNLGQVLCDFGQEDKSCWMGDIPFDLGVYHCNDGPLNAQDKIMVESLNIKADVLRNVIEKIGKQIIVTNNLSAPSTYSNKVQSDVVYYGYIRSDCEEEFKEGSIILENTTGDKVKLEVKGLKHFALFPGQVVVAIGKNTNSRFIVDKLCTTAVLPLPPCLPEFKGGHLQIVIASGPFTQNDNLAYQPLIDLVSYITIHKPHLVFLVGPVVPILSHPLITCGALAETYEELFDKVVSSIMEPLKGSWTKVVVVASSQDATAQPVYPTPPLLYKHKYSNLNFVADPSILSINGLVMAITATDILKHLGKVELASSGQDDRLGRLASHLVEQQRFYPLSPPDKELCIDSELYDSHAMLSVTPHILIVPSDLHYFIKLIHGSVVINPEHLSKGTDAGSFVRLRIQPPVDGIWSTSTHISAQILKI